MAVTNVYFVGKKRENEKVRCFKIMGNSHCLEVDSFENGIAHILPIHMLSIDELAEIVSGCFDESSNFKSALFSEFGSNENDTLKGISFDFNFVNILITRENAESNKICEMYYLDLDELEKKHTKKCGNEDADGVINPAILTVG